MWLKGRTRLTFTSGTPWRPRSSATPTRLPRLSAGRDAREREYTDDVLAIGEFAISLATHLRDVGAALTGIEGADREAIDELERAIAASRRVPVAGEQHGFAGKPLASIDLAAVRLAVRCARRGLGHPGPVAVACFRAADQRADHAASPGPAGWPAHLSRSVPAQELDGQIEEFGRDAVEPGLHSLPRARPDAVDGGEPQARLTLSRYRTWTTARAAAWRRSGQQARGRDWRIYPG